MLSGPGLLQTQWLSWIFTSLVVMYGNTFNRDSNNWLVVLIGLDAFDLPNDTHALCHFPENRMLPVKMRGLSTDNKKLLRTLNGTVRDIF